MFIILIDFIYFSSLYTCLTVILANILTLLFPITHRKVILKAGDLEHRCVRYKGSYPQRHSNWLKETPPNGVAKDPHLSICLFPGYSMIVCLISGPWSVSVSTARVLLLLELYKGKIGNR